MISLLDMACLAATALTDLWHVNCYIMKGKSVGIREVALHVGVSTASVSRAVNNPDSVSPELRSRIDSAIATLGYIPDAAARALLDGRPITVIPIMRHVAAQTVAAFAGRPQGS